MKKYNFVYDYPEYISHITLLYKAKNIDIPNFAIGFSKLNIEGLYENWDGNKN